MTLSYFRRHRKWFMVLMFLALVAMVGFGTFPSMWTKLNAWFGKGGERTVIGTIGGEKVRMGEVRDFVGNMQMAGEASRLWAGILGQKATDPQAREAIYRSTIGATAWPVMVRTLSGEKPSLQAAMTWYALYREARAAGFDTSESEVAARLKTLGQFGLTPQVIEQIVARLGGVRRDKFDEALRMDMTLRTYLEWLNEVCGGVVTPELRQEFVKNDDRVKVRLAVIKAADSLAEVKDVSEAALQEQFNKYKQHLPGKGPDGHGYRISDRVQIEYLVADSKAFEDPVRGKVTDAAIEAYYNAHKDPDFVVKEPAEAPAAAPAKETPKDQPPAAPAKEKTPPGAKPTPKAPAGPKGAPGEKGATTAGEKAAPAASAPAMKLEAPAPRAEAPQAKSEAAPPSPEAKPPEKKFRPLAEVREEIRKKLLRQEADAAALEAMQAIVAEIRPLKKAPDLRIYADGKKVRYVAPSGYQGEAQLAALPGLGTAARGQDTLPKVAVALQELVGAKAKTAVMEISEPFVGSEGEAYGFRVTAFQANHEPASLGDVRADVLADVRLKKAFEITSAKAEKLSAAAEKEGLEAAAKAAGVKTVESDWFAQERVFPVQYGGRFLTIPASLPEVGSNPVVVSECFRLAAENKKVSLVSLADEKSAVVVELEGHKPPREALFEQMRPLLAAQVGMELGGACLRQAIDLGSIQRRLAVVLQVPDEFHPLRSSRDLEDDSGGDF